MATALTPRRRLLIQADCLAGDVTGDCVHVTADRVSGRYQVEVVDPAAPTDLPSHGIIIRKMTSTRCTVQVAGIMDGIYTGLTPDVVTWVDAAGRLTQTEADGFQVMGIALASDVVLLFPNLGGALPSATSIGQVLFSLDGSTFTAEQPVVADVEDDGGWVTEGDLLVVVG